MASQCVPFVELQMAQSSGSSWLVVVSMIAYEEDRVGVHVPKMLSSSRNPIEL